MILKSKDELVAEVSRPWNPKGEVPMHSWLQESTSQSEQARLKALGNVVMPKQGAFALQILGHSFTSMP